MDEIVNLRTVDCEGGFLAYLHPYGCSNFLYKFIMADDNMLECLVADSAAFLKNAPLQQISRKIFTIRDVVCEIRDSATRQRLAVLPYTVEFREPSAESIKAVSEFSKKTGDFPSLSAVDIKVMALTYQLEKEFCGADHIKNEPEKKVQCVKGGGITNIKPEHGFFCGAKEENSAKQIDKMDMETQERERKVEEVEKEEEAKAEMDIATTENGSEEQMDEINDELENTKSDNEKGNVNIDDNDCGGGEDKEDLEEDDNGCKGDDQEEGDGGGWITPGNISKVKKEMGFEELDENAVTVKSACLTTDFAMQNVLMQMGLHVISLNGMIIHQARSYILKCYGCSKETTEMDRVFCKNCGNKTLRKVSVSVNVDGSLTYHLPRRARPMNVRGTKFSIPLPKPGRRAGNLILAEDQKQATQRLPRSRDTANALDQDFIARTSPFVFKDVTSKAFNKGFHLKQNSRKNPNEGKRTKSKRK